MLRADRLLGVLLADFIGFGRDERDELDAGLNQGVAVVFRCGEAGAGGQDLGQDFGDGCCGELDGGPGAASLRWREKWMHTFGK